MNQPQSTPPLDSPPPATGWSEPTRYLFIVIWLLIAGLLIWVSKPVWHVVALALIVAYLLQPLIKGVMRLRIPRPLAAMLSLFLLLLIVFLFPLIIIPAIVADIQPISIDFNGIFQNLMVWISHLPETLPGFHILGINIDLSPIYDQLFGSMEDVESKIQVHLPANMMEFLQQVFRSTTKVVGIATTVATNVIGGIGGALLFFVLLLLLTFYAAVDLPRLRSYIVGLAPDDSSEEWTELWRRTGQIWSAFFRGQLVLSVVIGIAVWLGLTLIGMPGALALGVLAGVLEVIPTLGPVLAAIPAVLLALLQGSISHPDVSNLTIMFIVIAMYLIIQQVENYVLVPRILGGSVGVHPALILLGVMVFTFQFGILGAFVATPVLATLLEWFRFYHARIVGRDPHPALANAAVASSKAAHAPPTIPRATAPLPPGETEEPADLASTTVEIVSTQPETVEIKPLVEKNDAARMDAAS